MRIQRIKTILVPIFVFVAVIVGVGAVVFRVAQGYLETSSEKQMETMAQKYQIEMDNMQKNIMQSVNIMATTIEERIQGLEDIEEQERCDEFTNELRRYILTNGNYTNGCIAVYLRFDPDLCKGEKGIFYIKKQGKRNFDEEILTNISAYDQKDVEHVGWYYIPKQKEAASWIGPYYNENISVNMCSYVVPLYYNGQFIGVTGMDIDFTYMLEKIKKMEVYERGYAYLKDQNGQVLYRPDIDQTEEEWIEKEKKLSNGSYLVLAAPREEIYENRLELRRLVFRMSAVISVLFGLALLYFHCSIVRKELAKEEYNRQLSALGNIYIAMYVLDIEKNLMKIVNVNKSLLQLIQNVKCNRNGQIEQASEKMRLLIENEVNDEYKEEMISFINFEDLDKRMRGKPTISWEFVANSEGWCRARFIRMDKEYFGPTKNILFAIEQIKEQKRREQKLAYLAQTDLMTGILNRGSGERTIRELMAMNKSGMFCLLDADKFKSINDNYGHAVGDKVIIAIAETLQQSFRERDVVMRLGGDEFAVYAVGVNDEQAGRIIINRFFRKLSQVDIEEMGERRIVVSLGAAFFDGTSKLTFEQLYHRADEGTYHSKSVVGNAMNFYQGEE